MTWLDNHLTLPTYWISKRFCEPRPPLNSYLSSSGFSSTEVLTSYPLWFLIPRVLSVCTPWPHSLCPTVLLIYSSPFWLHSRVKATLCNHSNHTQCDKVGLRLTDGTAITFFISCPLQGICSFVNFFGRVAGSPPPPPRHIHTGTRVVEFVSVKCLYNVTPVYNKIT